MRGSIQEGVVCRTAPVSTAAARSSWGTRLAVYAIPCVVSLAFFTLVMRRMIEAGDFPEHVRVAQGLAEGTRSWPPHFMYQALVILVHALTPANWATAASVVIVGAGVIAAGILAHWTTAAIPRDRVMLRVAVAATLPMALLLANPLLLPGPLSRDPWLIGYFPANVFHNPTNLASKPLALVLFAVAARALAGASPPTLRRIGGSCAAVIVAAFVKPSYLVALLPATGLFALLRWRRTDWRLLVAGLVVPAVSVVAYQYLWHYATSVDGVSVVFAPLMVISLYSPTEPVILVGKLIASVAFPLAVVLSFPGAIRHLPLVLAWLTFACGTAYGYLLAEAGGQADSGNFLWSGQLAAFVLFAASAAFMVSATVRLRSAVPRVWMSAAVCSALLAWHVMSGVRHLQASWYD